MLLALETSGPLGSLALFDGERLLGEAELDSGERHAATLLVALDALLVQSGRARGEIARIALSIGPGSFTGLRIGLASALGLAFGTERTVVPVPTLAALAFQAGGDAPVLPLVDARRGEVYAGVYEPSGVALVADSCSPLEAFLARAPAAGPITLIGSGACLYRAKLEAALGPRARFLPEAAGVLRAASVGRLGLRIAAAGGALAPERVELRYLRRAEAEAKRAALHEKAEPIP
jgi:tRNA threonylcarbamoyladenosine biosynthesis protein TsaB